MPLKPTTTKVISLSVWMLLTISVAVSMAQDPQFSQFYAAPVYLNPAFAGSVEDTRLTVIHRRQWPSLEASFVTSAVAIDKNFSRYRSGVGLMVANDHVNPIGLSRTEISAQYAYLLPMTKVLSFRAGFQAGYAQRSADFTRFTFGDQYSNSGLTGLASREDFVSETRGNMDLALGGLLFSRRFFLGMAMHHVNRPNEAFTNVVSRMPVRTTLHTGFLIPLNKFKYGRRNRRFTENEEELKGITPAIVYKSQGKFDQLDVGLHFNYNPFVVGFWYRGLPIKTYERGLNNHEALIILAGLRFQSLSIGYSYDVTISKLAAYTGGAHEISLNYLFNTTPNGKKGKVKGPRSIPCPTI